MKCPYCEGINANNAMFCEHCRKSLLDQDLHFVNEKVNEQESHDQKREKPLSTALKYDVNKNRTGIIGVAAAIVIICIAIVFINNKQNAKQDTSQAAKQEIKQANQSIVEYYDENEDPGLEDIYHNENEDSGLEEDIYQNEITEDSQIKENDSTEIQQENVEYIIPDSDSKYLSEEDIAGLSLQELNYAKNEIYARHGRRFKSTELNLYFSSKTWYEDRYDPEDFDANYSELMLNDYEIKNAAFISEIEHLIEPAGYQLDSN